MNPWERKAQASHLWVYRPPSRARRWLDALRDVPYAFADKVGDDQEPALARRLFLAILLSFGLACLLWLLAWWLR
jgi:hypothetical protein